MSEWVEVELEDRLPGCGESEVALSFRGRSLIVEVKFEESPGVESIASIEFEKVSFHSAGAFPGVASLGGVAPKEFRTGTVIGIGSSGLAEEWTSYWERNGVPRECNHYVSFWAGAGLALNVIASRVKVG